MFIGNRDTDRDVLVIAEIGNNHEGNFYTALELIYAAASCGVDGVKFQTYKTEHYVSEADTQRFAQLKSFELSYEQFEELSRVAHSLNLLFLSTPFDIESAKFLNPIVDAYKISSGDINFYPLLDIIITTRKPILLSTGASNRNIIASTVEYFELHNYDDLILLHCVSCYPVSEEQTNLSAIRFLIDTFGYPAGYSDHTLGIGSAVLSVAAGARIIEKHFTLNKSHSTFHDHQISADPTDMSELVRRVRVAHILMGDGNKKIQPCEAQVLKTIRRSIVATTDLSSGHLITHDDLTWTRPAIGLPPGDEYKLLGKKLHRDIKKGSCILEGDVEC